MTSVNASNDRGKLRAGLTTRCAVAALSAIAAVVLTAGTASADPAPGTGGAGTEPEYGTTDWPWIDPPFAGLHGVVGDGVDLG